MDRVEDRGRVGGDVLSLGEESDLGRALDLAMRAARGLELGAGAGRGDLG